MDHTRRLSGLWGDCCYCTLVRKEKFKYLLASLNVVATYFSSRVVAGRVLTRQPSLHRVEWAYCFDVHLNAFVPFALAIFGVQMVLWPCMYIPYSGKLSRERTLMEKNFHRENFRGLLAGAAKRCHTSKFHTMNSHKTSKVFSLDSFLLYSMHS